MPIETVIRECTACELCCHADLRLMGMGAIPAPIMVISEAPSGKDLMRRRLFSDPFGQYLLKNLVAAGYKQNDVYLTTLLKCPIKADQSMPATGVMTCLSFLHEQIRQVKPKVIITLGSTVFSSLVTAKKKAKLTTIHGDTFVMNGINIVPTYHPSFVVTSDKDLRKKEFYKDLWRVHEMVFGVVGLHKKWPLK